MGQADASTQGRGLGSGRICALKSLLLAATLALCGTGAGSAQTPQTQAFLKLTGVTGTSTNVLHRGEVELVGFSANASTSGNRSVCGQITIVKNIDQTSPQFLGMLYRGYRSERATITFEVVGGSPYDFYKIDLDAVTVQNITQSDPQNSTTVVETITLAATRYRYSYYPKDAQGRALTPVTFGWDCAAYKQL
jgi:type VI protein secretion system component Hcp